MGYETAGDIYAYNLARGEELVICKEKRGQWLPSVSGDRIVWQDYRSGRGFDIYLYNLSSKEELVVCEEPSRQWLPKVRDDTVAWIDGRHQNWDI